MDIREGERRKEINAKYFIIIFIPPVADYITFYLLLLPTLVILLIYLEYAAYINM